MKDHAISMLLLSCCAFRFPQSVSTAWGSESPSAFSASLLYIYASDSSYWPYLTGKLLRDNDTLLILPGVVYKVWCEVLPKGRPRISSNNRDVIAHRPIPRKTMAHVELDKSLFSTLDGTGDEAEQAKLWCDYTNGTAKLRTTVALRPFSMANTTCDFSNVNALVAEGSSVNFTCTSWSGFPQPEHSCMIEGDRGGVRFPAQSTSIVRLPEKKVVTTFSIPVDRRNQHASIDCRAKQQAAYLDSGRDFQESYVQEVRPLGKTFFKFMSASAKQCELTVSGGSRFAVVCQSKGGLPETEHKCWIAGANGSEALPLMAKVQEDMYTTEISIDRSWRHQNSTVTCVLQQRSHYYSQAFSFQIPGFKRSQKICTFSQLANGLFVNCISTNGIPSSKHLCVAHLRDSSTALLATKSENLTDGLKTSYMVPTHSLHRGSRISCTIEQDGFPPAGFAHTPQFTESRKSCRFINSSWEVKAVCEFSSGYPATQTKCRLLIANSSVSLNLRPDQKRASTDGQLFSRAYTVRLPGPTVSHAGGSIACRVFQGAIFAKKFSYRISEYRSTGVTPAEPKLRMSGQTVLTLILSLLAALLLLLLMALPVRALRRCLKRSPQKGAAAAAAHDSNFPSSRDGGAPHQLPPQPISHFALAEILSDVCQSRGYRASRQGGMPEIDQYSMFEFGYRPDPSNKRKSVLADALLRCQMEQNRREFRFSM